ncbi:MAG: serine/threonine protein kinase [Chloroflexi bacterium]|nr:serine/threonine protein kinase [Chloroflexota bacterium]
MPMTETTGPEFPGYQLQSLIGRGGMGRVYRAEQLATRRPVAVKVLDRATTDPAKLAAFRREAATVAQLEHPHVVPLYDYGDHQGTQYLVFRFLTGGTVADRIKAGPIPVDAALRWLGDVADALDAAHKRGIVHRDVKPSNLLLDDAGHVYLGDFGIAAAAVDLEGSAAGGSAAYASPEQGRGATPDASSDVYSLAVTAFEMLTGHKPFRAETALGMLVRHMHDPIPSARALLPDLPTAVDGAFTAGMAKDPRERPATAGDFASRLRRAFTAAPSETLVVPGAPAPSVPTARKAPQAWLLGLAAAAVLLCLLAVGITGGGLAAFLTSATPTAAAVRPPPIVAATASPAKDALPLADDFSDPASGFGLMRADDGSVEYAEGTLRITSLAGGLEWFSPYVGLEEQDLRIEVRARRVDGPPLSEVAVICRWQDAANYVAAAWRADGRVSLWKKSDGLEERWLDWMAVPGPEPAPDAAHLLQLTCRGSAIVFVVDGATAAEATDPSPSAGSMALMAGLLEPGRLVVEFDDLLVTRP